MTAPRLLVVPPIERIRLLVGASLWIGLTGWLDFLSGVEYRVFPLYFLPILLVGWRLAYGHTLFLSALSACTWLVANYQAGMQYSSQSVWMVNTLVMGVSFATVGTLMVYARNATRLAEARSRVDPLTGLLNASTFTAESARVAALCDRHHRPITIVFLDLDDFKQVNDRHGHAAGDAVLKLVGGVLHAAVRETDLAARMGGDEFALALAETDKAGAHVMLGRLRERLRERMESAPRAVTMSIGAVTSHAKSATIETLLREADGSLYEAKKHGKDRFVVTERTA